MKTMGKFILLTILSIFLLVGCGYELSDEYKETIKSGIIQDMYVDTSDPSVKVYYMNVYIEPDIYDIRISKHDFMTYKIGEYVDIKFKGNKPRCIVK